MPSITQLLTLLTAYLSVSSYARPLDSRHISNWLTTVTGDQFIGFHGTNSVTAALWIHQGFISKPTGGGGTSSADHQLGLGLYVTDDLDIATAFANNNARTNKGTKPSVCAILTHPSGWIDTTKVFIPDALVRDSSNAGTSAKYEKSRVEYVQKVVPHNDGTKVVRFSRFSPVHDLGQLALPDTITNTFTVECFNPDTESVPKTYPRYPEFLYTGKVLRTAWDIVPENVKLAQDIVKKNGLWVQDDEVVLEESESESEGGSLLTVFSGRVVEYLGW